MKNTPVPPHFLRLLASWLLLTLFAVPVSLSAQGTASGSIEGRVFDADRGGYLERARLTIEGTNEEAFTDETGQYRLANLPAGTVRVRVFFTGLAPQTTAVTVVAGQATKLNLTLSANAARNRAGTAEAEQAIELAAFVVQASKEMDGAAIAINEQRFSRTIKDVVASDEFGTVVDGTPAEVLKFLPGITVNYGAGEARTISMNGAPATNVPVTVGGFEFASAAGFTTSRVVSLDSFSVNNISRIEVNHSPTPESPGSALAGSINMVPRSAFERSHPQYILNGFFTFKSGERELRKTPGPHAKATHKITPGFNLSAVVPVNKRFGFTFSANHVDQYSYENVANVVWRANGFATTGPVAATATNSFPDTTPDNPYLTDYNLRDSTRGNQADAAGFTADFKLTSNDTLSFVVLYHWIGVIANNRLASFLTRRVAPGAWGPTFTQGEPLKGEVRISAAAQDWLGTTTTPTLTWRHNGPVWKMDAGVGFSRQSLHTRNGDKGFFGATQATRQGVTVGFRDISPLALNRSTITVTDAAGQPVDPYNLSNYSLQSASIASRDAADTKRSIGGSIRRDFTVKRTPISIKLGAEIKSLERDLINTTDTYNFVGQDRVASTSPLNSDDGAGIVVDEAFSQRPGRFGFPSVQWIDHYEYYDLYRKHPEYFTNNPTTTYTARVNASKYAQEVISSTYLRGDVSFFNRLLQFVGGLRAEQTNVRGSGPLSDPTRNYQRDSAGNVIIVAGRPVPIVPTTDTLGVAKRVLIERGQQTRKEYLRLFPSLNAIYNIRENLKAHAAYYQSLGRPDFGQYANGLTLPDTSVAPTTATVITVNNPLIKAWSAETYKVRLEYYFEKVGTMSVGGFHREFKNFFGSSRFPATPEFLQANSLDPSEYGAYDVVTNTNIKEVVRMDGCEVAYKQALTFLPDWARGLQVFANSSWLSISGGDATSNFAGFFPRSANWGFSLNRPKYKLQMSWNYRSDNKRAPAAAGRGVEADSYNWGVRALTCDVTADYNINRHLTCFFNMRNVTAVPEDTQVYGSLTPDYAKFRQRADYGAAVTVGLRGTF